LSKRLRRNAEPALEDLRLLARFRSSRLPSLLETLAAIGDLRLGPDISLSGRQKNAWTIIEKLQREGTRLETVQDVSGIRLVVPGDRNRQNQVVRDIERAFGGRTRALDRRLRPSHGYRAVHVVIDPDGAPVEVQVRTGWQDKWAQLFERLGDQWGRQIRYGGPPDAPDEVLLVGGVEIPRGEVVEYLRQTAEFIDEAESAEVQLSGQETLLAAEADDSYAGIVLERTRDLSVKKATVSDLYRRAEDLIRSVRQLAPEIDVQPPPGSVPIRDTLRRLLFAPGKAFFVIAYRRSGRTLIEVSRCNLAQEAAHAHSRLTEIYFADRDVEIVLLFGVGDALLTTHARYFRGWAGLARAPV